MFAHDKRLQNLGFVALQGGDLIHQNCHPFVHGKVHVSDGQRLLSILEPLIEKRLLFSGVGRVFAAPVASSCHSPENLLITGLLQKKQSFIIILFIVFFCLEGRNMFAIKDGTSILWKFEKSIKREKTFLSGFLEEKKSSLADSEIWSLICFRKFCIFNVNLNTFEKINSKFWRKKNSNIF